ncbi:hypothetical protein Spp001_36 [Shewanella phage Spp001]|uniref:Uncharacterized protein n=1 Tax=Shewanella phage Spp001 TaxID=1445859 RepID=W6EK93_9CAUD|nr:hypothetical protein Spp001_36 [Shewanella phage Spp001]AHJ10544.1 hypothetical protein Spp001_36 [Shewanella phage Spp001]
MPIQVVQAPISVKVRVSAPSREPTLVSWEKFCNVFKPRVKTEADFVQFMAFLQTILKGEPAAGVLGLSHMLFQVAE